MLEKIKTKIKNINSSRFKKGIFFLFVFIFLFTFINDSGFFGINNTFADGVAKGSGADSDLANDIAYLTEWLQFIVGMAGAIIGAFTSLMTILLEPSWVNGTLFDISSHLKKAWILVSNFVYLIFAGILIVISFMNIIGKGDSDTFMLKKALPRFIVGVLIVPVSWFFVTFMIGLSSILTIQVFTWPLETFEANTSKMINGKKINWCDKRVINLQGNFTDQEKYDDLNRKIKKSAGDAKEDRLEEIGKVRGKAFFSCPEGEKMKSMKELIYQEGKEEFKIGGLIALYSFGVMDLTETTALLDSQLGGINSLMDLSAKVVFDLLFLLVYMILLVALFMALFARFIMIWLYMIISPLFGLMYFSKSAVGKLSDKVNVTEFIRLVFVPVFVAAALSAGFVFLLIIGEGIVTKEELNKGIGGDIGEKSLDLGITSIVIKGEVTGDTTSSFVGALMQGFGGVLGYLIFKIFGLAFLWVAVMAAIRGSEVTKSVTEPIYSLGKSVGDTAMKLPQYIPIPGTGMTIGGATAVGQNIANRVSNLPRDRAMKRWQNSKLHDKFFGPGAAKLTETLEDIKNTANKGESLVKIEKLLKTNSANELYNSREMLEEVFTGTNIGSQKAIGLKDTKNLDDFYNKLAEINNELANSTTGSGFIFGNGRNNMNGNDVKTHFNTTVNNSSQTTNNTTVNISNLDASNIQDIAGMKDLKITDGDVGEVVSHFNINDQGLNNTTKNEFIHRLAGLLSVPNNNGVFDTDDETYKNILKVADGLNGKFKT